MIITTMLAGQTVKIETGYNVRWYNIDAEGIARAQWWSITGLYGRIAQGRFDHAEEIAHRRVAAGAEWAELIEADTGVVVARVAAAGEEVAK